MHSPLTLPLRL